MFVLIDLDLSKDSSFLSTRRKEKQLFEPENSFETVLRQVISNGDINIKLCMGLIFSGLACNGIHWPDQKQRKKRKLYSCYPAAVKLTTHY